MDTARRNPTTSTEAMIEVGGTPRPQPRPRFVGGGVVANADASAKRWRERIERAAREAVAANGPVGGAAVEVDLVFSFETAHAAKVGQPHTAKPDADNLAKLALDAMVAAKLLGGDDARAATLHVRKVWGRSSGMVAVVRCASGPESGAPVDPMGSAPGWLAGVGV